MALCMMLAAPSFAGAGTERRWSGASTLMVGDAVFFTHAVKALALTITSAAAPHLEEPLNDPNQHDDGILAWDGVYNVVFNHRE